MPASQLPSWGSVLRRAVALYLGFLVVEYGVGLFWVVWDPTLSSAGGGSRIVSGGSGWVDALSYPRMFFATPMPLGFNMVLGLGLALAFLLCLLVVRRVDVLSQQVDASSPSPAPNAPGLRPRRPRPRKGNRASSQR
jgi:hypothetical protein